MSHWLVKSEASAYSWTNLVADGRTAWDGVRNFQARNNLAAMRKGDTVFFYHSVDEKQVVGIARVVREAYAEPTAGDDGWLAVDLEPAEALAHPVGLEQIKSDSRLRDIALVRQGRLSVMPVTDEEYRVILSLSQAPGASGPKGAVPRKTAKGSKPPKARKAATASESAKASKLADARKAAKRVRLRAAKVAGRKAAKARKPDKPRKRAATADKKRRRSRSS